MLVAACACSTSRVETRKIEKADVYDALPAEAKTLVDQGRIRKGMPAGAVYIALGRPSRIIRETGPGGLSATRWIYYGFSEEEPEYFSDNHGLSPSEIGGGRMTYVRTRYVRALVTLVDDQVLSWRIRDRYQGPGSGS